MTDSKPVTTFETLELLDATKSHEFIVPSKEIDDGEAISFWLTSKAYTDVMKLVLQLNVSMFPTKRPNGLVDGWSLDSGIELSSPVVNIRSLMTKLEKIIEEAPPDLGPRRFGNVSFRKWYGFVESRADELLEKHLPQNVLDFNHSTAVTPLNELKSYFLGSFGSAQRLDYGTGHELSFLAFIGSVWKLGGFPTAEPGAQERGIVAGIIEPYLHLVRSLILTYTLEPAGSHGVWGLDDHSFIPYILGSAQLSPPIDQSIRPEIPTEGSFTYAPKTGDVTKKNIVDRERKRNMYFSAIGFIYDVKKGPFWEHSPILFDVSGVTAGWAKINKGMIKMYNAEVLSKFPVVQHFPFGSLFRWEEDPKAAAIETSVHAKSQPAKAPMTTPTIPQATGPARAPFEGTKAPWAMGAGSSIPPAIVRPPPIARGRPPFEGTKAPWAAGAGLSTTPSTRLPPTAAASLPQTKPQSSKPPLPPDPPGSRATRKAPDRRPSPVNLSAPWATSTRHQQPPAARTTTPDQPQTSDKKLE